MGIPKRWEKYSPVGCRVPGTRFLPFKVPLKSAVFENRPYCKPFTPDLLVEKTPGLKAVIDLTDTTRYYHPQEFTSRGVLHVKINIVGGGKLPTKQKRNEFFDAVDQLRRTLDRDSDALIGVHCTHGLNRTGYLICKYMVLRMKIDPQEAINKFEEARGHPIERQLYISDIMIKEKVSSIEPVPVVNWRTERQSSTSSSSFSSRSKKIKIKKLTPQKCTTDNCRK